MVKPISGWVIIKVSLTHPSSMRNMIYPEFNIDSGRYELIPRNVRVFNNRKSAYDVSVKLRLQFSGFTFLVKQARCELIE